MKRNVLLAVLATAMFMAGCSGSSDGEVVASRAASEQVALRLIVELGSDAAAADALIIAMDRGYSGPRSWTPPTPIDYEATARSKASNLQEKPWG